MGNWGEAYSQLRSLVNVVSVTACQTLFANIPIQRVTPCAKRASVSLLGRERISNPAIQRHIDLVVEGVVAALLDVVHDANG